MFLNTISRDEGTGPMGTREGFMKLFGRAVEESERGVALGADIVVAVGRKEKQDSTQGESDA